MAAEKYAGDDASAATHANAATAATTSTTAIPATGSTTASWSVYHCGLTTTATWVDTGNGVRTKASGPATAAAADVGEHEDGRERQSCSEKARWWSRQVACWFYHLLCFVSTYLL